MYPPIQLKAFDDTCISFEEPLYMSEQRLQEFCVETTKNNNIKEEGGFLFGKYYNKDNKYTIFVEKLFKPKSYEYNDQYQIKFGVKAMHHLDALLQNNKEQDLLGWFHTHPGHTLFLSIFDLNTHIGTFPEPWQISLVIDPLTPSWNTAIFTRTKNNSINNKKQLKKYIKLKNL